VDEPEAQYDDDEYADEGDEEPEAESDRDENGASAADRPPVHDADADEATDLDLPPRPSRPRRPIRT
jgi:hypothetical protein